MEKNGLEDNAIVHNKSIFTICMEDVTCHAKVRNFSSSVEKYFTRIDKIFIVEFLKKGNIPAKTPLLCVVRIW